MIEVGRSDRPDSGFDRAGEGMRACSRQDCLRKVRAAVALNTMAKPARAA